MKNIIASVVVLLAAEMACAAEGVWGRAPNGEFWNGHSVRFIFAPAFGFKAVAGAKAYEYEVIDDYHRVERFRAAEPTASLEGVWAKLPVGYVTVICRGVDDAGAVVGEAGRRTFWKKAAFTGNYPPRKRSYAFAKSKVIDYFLSTPQLQHLKLNGKPDPTYPLNGYPSKMLAAEIRTLVSYAEGIAPHGDGIGRRAEAIDIACKAADYLIAERVPADQPLAFFTRTYAKEGSEYGRFKGEQDTIMLVYPGMAGEAFLKLYGYTKDPKHLDAAVKIAETYLKLQGDDGTWFLKMNAVTGKPTCPNRLVPDGVMVFLESVYAATGREEFRRAGDRAFAWIERGPMCDWNWEGQFEDVKPADSRWRNLTKHPACATAMYLLKRFPGDVTRLEQAKALVKFGEDQFVEWVPPYDNGRYPGDDAEDDGARFWCRPYKDYVTPCALEQYACYAPIDASAAKFIKSYLALYKATKDRVYLDKAKALGDTATRMQEDDGFIDTWWMKGVSRTDYRYHPWINCMLYTAEALGALAEADRNNL